VARDLDTREALAVGVSYTRSSLDAEILLKQVLQYCKNKPLILVDHEPWYVDMLKKRGSEYQQVARGNYRILVSPSCRGGSKHSTTTPNQSSHTTSNHIHSSVHQTLQPKNQAELILTTLPALTLLG
jgi:transposase-like protein